jgi:hypothetical protein
MSSDSEIVHTTSSCCPQCGCDPNDPWYCHCSQPGCPCSEADDDDWDEEN